MEAQAQAQAKPEKLAQFELRYEIYLVKQESLVIEDQHASVKVIRSSTHRPSHHGNWVYCNGCKLVRVDLQHLALFLLLIKGGVYF